MQMYAWLELELKKGVLWISHPAQNLTTAITEEYVACHIRATALQYDICAILFSPNPVHSLSSLIVSP